MYEKAHKLLLGGDYRGAVRYYEALDARYPFSEEARARRGSTSSTPTTGRASRSCGRRGRPVHPRISTHPRVDHAMYLRGLVYFERSPNFLERWFNTDLS